MFAQYKLYFYIGIGALILFLIGATYFFYSNNERNKLKLAQETKEKEYYQFQLTEAVNSHNGYVTDLKNLQATKEKIQIKYTKKMEEISNANYSSITAPLVVIPSGLQSFTNYSSSSN